MPSNPLSFTVAGFKLKAAKLRKDKLTLHGKRVGLEFKTNTQKWVDIENLDIDIEKPASGDFGPALDAIFTEDLSSLVPSLPFYRQRFAQCKLFPPADPDQLPLSCKPEARSDMTANQVGGAMSAPTLDARPEAQFSRFARSVKYTGASVVGMVVDTDGKPANLRVVSPAGLGLDEQALAAVKGWHFTPAKRNGIPVKTEIDVEVSFKIY